MMQLTQIRCYTEPANVVSIHFQLMLFNACDENIRSSMDPPLDVAYR